MQPLRQQLEQHLVAASFAYGSDLILPPGRVAPAAERAPPGAAASTPGAAAAIAVPGPTATPPAPAAAKAPPRTSPAAAPAPAAAAPDPTAADPSLALQELRAQALQCTRCKLHQGRRTVVFGEGNPRPRVLFVGEAPGAVEDQTGRPFVGPAGQLLDRILQGAMGLPRDAVYIANINKCRPPGNREPEPDEVAACLPFLQRQVAILRPEVIVALGRTAAHNLLGTTEPMRALRGRELWFQHIPVVVTWHPAFLLRDPSHKRETWEDIKRVNRMLGLPEIPNPGPA